MSARTLPLVLCAILCATALAKDREGAELRGVTRRMGVRSSMRIEVRRLPVEPAVVSLFHEARRRALPVDGAALGFVAGDALAVTGSDEQGCYRISGLARGHYEVRAVADDGMRALAPLTVRGVGGEYLLDLGVEPGPHGISGRVRLADDRPFTGWLVVTQEAEGRTAAPWLNGAETVRPDEHGLFSVRGLLDSAVEIHAVVPGRGRIPCLQLPRPTESLVELVVPDEESRPDEIAIAAGDRVSGQVLDVERGTPAEGACVHLAAADGASTHVCIADADGRYTFHDVPGEPFCLFVSGGGWLDADGASVMRSRRLEAGDALEVTLRAVWADETATVLVVDQHGRPCAGVEVRASQPHIPYYYAHQRVHAALAPGVTDARGRCRLGPFVRSAPVSFTLAHPRIVVAGRDPWVVKPGGKMVAHVRRVRGAMGRVDVPAGVSPRRVQLSVQGLAQPVERPWRLRLRPDASFRLPTASGGYGRVRAAAWRGEEYLVGRCRIAPRKHHEPEPLLILQPARPETAWRFEVLGPQGEPVSDGWAICRMRAHRHPGHETARIDEGYADVECSTPGARMDSVLFCAFRDGSDRPLSHRHLLLAGPSAGFHTVRLEQGRDLCVSVCDTEGEPVPDVHLQAWMADEDASSGTRSVTDPSGNGRLFGLGPGAIRLIVETPPHFVDAAPVKIAADAIEARVVLVPHVAARIQVTRPDGSSVAGARVRASSATSGLTAFEERGALRLVTDANGRCRLPPLRPGVRIDLQVDTPDEDLLPFVARWWEPADGTIELQSAVRMSGRVVDGRGNPIVDATVWVRARPGSPPIRQWGTRWWRDAEGFVLGALTDSDGTFDIERLACGEVEVRAVTTTPDDRELMSDAVVTTSSASDLVLRIAAEP